MKLSNSYFDPTFIKELLATKIYQRYLKNNFFYTQIICDKKSKNTFWRYPLYLSEKIDLD